jgi:hypothetical protein
MADDDFVFVPPRKTYLDDVEVYDAALGGIVPAWKSLIYHGAIAKQRIEAQARADVAPHTPVRDEDQPPPVVADAEPDPAEGLREEFQLHTLLAKIARFEQRIEALEKRKKANDLLLALEAAEAEAEPSQDRTLN